jgi:ribosomal protein S18 acetylase RimI-like enzyme
MMRRWWSSPKFRVVAEAAALRRPRAALLARRRRPVAGLLLTERSGTWQCDLLHVPGVSPATVKLWERAREMIASLEPVDVPALDDDVTFTELLRRDGSVAGEGSAITWLDAGDRVAPTELPAGFALVDRARESGPHPMRHRSGEEVEARLRECPLYDPALDLAVETHGGEVAGYSLYWFDPVTTVGLLEPMRVEDAFRRRGLARAMLTEGLERLARRGATRLKVGYSTEIAGALYRGAGFRPTAKTTWYRAAR